MVVLCLENANLTTHLKLQRKQGDIGLDKGREVRSRFQAGYRVLLAIEPKTGEELKRLLYPTFRPFHWHSG